MKYVRTLPNIQVIRLCYCL